MPHAIAAGLAPAFVASLERSEPPNFHHADEAAIAAFVGDLYGNRSVSTQTYDRLVALIGADAIVDLIGILGYYALISMTVKAFEIPT